MKLIKRKIRAYDGTFGSRAWVYIARQTRKTLWSGLWDKIALPVHSVAWLQIGNQIRVQLCLSTRQQGYGSIFKTNDID